MKLTLGRTVFYQLSQGDVDWIDQSLPMLRDGRQVRNPVRDGQVLPAVVVALFGGETASCCNLKVQLDGEDCYWATSRSLGDAPGTWAWPPRV